MILVSLVALLALIGLPLGFVVLFSSLGSTPETEYLAALSGRQADFLDLVERHPHMRPSELMAAWEAGRDS